MTAKQKQAWYGVGKIVVAVLIPLLVAAVAGGKILNKVETNCLHIASNTTKTENLQDKQQDMEVKMTRVITKQEAMHDDIKEIKELLKKDG